MKQLAIAKDLTLPIDFVTQKAAFMGRTGSGKTYAATKAAELMLDAGAQVIAIDPVGVWYGLRLDKNGRDPSGIEIPVLGGLHGDKPLEPTAGALIADLVVDRALSVILDVSQWERDTDKNRFAEDFASRFFFRKKASPSAVHLFVEECQEFVPQNPGPKENDMLHAFHRLIKLGRNFGIGVSLISQRPQEVNKKALNQTELLFAFQMTGPQERKAIGAWVNDKGGDVDVADVLPKLAVGEPHIWSPQWLQISRTVKIAPKRTFNASSTPTFGAKTVEAKPLGSIDLEKLEKAMAATVERAKETDPKELRAEISKLKRELAAKPGRSDGAKAVVDHDANRRLVDAAVRQATQAFERDQRAFRSGLKKEIERLQRQFEPIGTTIAALSSIAAASFEAPATEIAALPIARTVERAPAPVPRKVPDVVPLSGDITSSQQRMLNEMAQLQLLGVSRPTIKQIAVFCGVSHTTGTFLQNVRDLEKAGYIERGRGDAVLTSLGQKSAASDPPRSDLVEMWLDKLDGAQSKMLRTIVERGAPISTEDLAASLNVSPTTGTFLQNLRDLRGYGVIDWARGVAQPSELLFP